MHIRTIELKDAENYLALSKRIESSGYMLFEPEEKKHLCRETTGID